MEYKTRRLIYNITLGLLLLPFLPLVAMALVLAYVYDIIREWLIIRLRCHSHGGEWYANGFDVKRPWWDLF